MSQDPFSDLLIHAGTHRIRLPSVAQVMEPRSWIKPYRFHRLVPRILERIRIGRFSSDKEYLVTADCLHLHYVRQSWNQIPVDRDSFPFPFLHFLRSQEHDPIVPIHMLSSESKDFSTSHPRVIRSHGDGANPLW